MSRFRVILAAGIVVHLAAFGLMLGRLEPFYTFFYSLAWWSYILVVASYNQHRYQCSLLFRSGSEFSVLFLGSALFWLVFEVFNFRLQNWHYLGLPVEPYLRWPGYLLAFGTVLPGILETELLLRNWGLFRGIRGPVVRVTNGLLVRLFLLGALMTIAAVVNPYSLFPLIWLGPLFLLDPIVHRLEGSSGSLIGRAHDGRYGLVCRLLISGFFCGLFWEFWNFWAGSKWYYTIPRFDFLKIFEMPLLGYLGFPVFALECYLFYRLSRRIWQAARNLGLVRRLLMLGLLGAFFLMVMMGIDTWTVVSFKLMFGGAS